MFSSSIVIAFVFSISGCSPALGPSALTVINNKTRNLDLRSVLEDVLSQASQSVAIQQSLSSLMSWTCSLVSCPSFPAGTVSEWLAGPPSLACFSMGRPSSLCPVAHFSSFTGTILFLFIKVSFVVNAQSLISVNSSFCLGRALEQQRTGRFPRYTHRSSRRYSDLLVAAALPA